MNRPRDEGVATVWTALTAVGLIAVTMLVWWIGAAITARHRTEAAADLGALAAAAHAADGPTTACARAQEVADHEKATVTSCRWNNRDAFVEVRSTVTPAPGLPPPTARARAGPVEQPP
ncbi:Rv3654c family TadE-like protein [Amycolatopsis jiangsuensis]|uniref:Secretion/DNA translocation related TadE-like protein n=1 Tax=Amycolatopsis jiangsuensis TaxID=1181879 RepID=A0A840IYJ5_9PSEU|nr:Rv3654c family TadE-like protein [Amycolatopsis jiangsuensis]MBB4687746.1 secretion/DNA translocation related TadE-like protein [Amycolatopsis jiangsuensis]